MSVSVNFKDLKYSLYEILELSKKAPENFIKLLVKNKELSEELCNHIIIANQILLNSQTREKYDEYLNEIHGVDKNIDEVNVMEKYNDFINREPIIIPKEDISDNKDFNDKFDAKNNQNTSSEDEICSNPTVFEDFAKIDNESTLYIEDSISTGNFTSLDMAFKIQKINLDLPFKVEGHLDIVKYKSVENRTVEDKIKEYSDITYEYINSRNNESLSRATEILTEILSEIQYNNKLVKVRRSWLSFLSCGIFS